MGSARSNLIRRAMNNKPTIELWFCGSCGCYDRDQEHASDCVWKNRTPRFSVTYVATDQAEFDQRHADD